MPWLFVNTGDGNANAGFFRNPRILSSMREKGKACFTSYSRINGGVAISPIS